MKLRLTWLAWWTSLMVLAAPIASAADELVVYSGRSDKFIRPVVEQFEKNTGIKVILHSAKSAALMNKLRAEGDKTEADLFISNDAGSLQMSANLGLFQPLPADKISVIPANYRAKDNGWVGLSARARVLVVNENAKGLDFVKSVFDLADPRLKGRIGVTHSANGSFIAGVTVYQQTAGDQKTLDWLTGLVDNANGKFFNKHSKIVKAVANGQVDIGLVNHYYIYRHLDKHPKAPIRILLPDQGEDAMGVAWNVAGVGLVKHSNKREQAMQLLEYLISPAGQKVFAEVNREYPTRPGVETAGIIPPVNSYNVADINMGMLGDRRVETIDLIEKSGMP